LTHCLCRGQTKANAQTTLAEQLPSKTLQLPVSFVAALRALRS
jgi:hypothetical protein